MGLNTVPCAPRLVLKALGARTSMASRRARKVGEQVRQCALRMRAPLRANCDEGPVRCHVQNAPFFTPMVHVSPTYGARDVRVGLLSEQGTGGGATHRPVLAQPCADRRRRVGGANCGVELGDCASYVRNFHPPRCTYFCMLSRGCTASRCI